jgi:hypothetical protein
MNKKDKKFDTFDKIGFALIGLIVLGMAIRSVVTANNADGAVRALSGIVLLVSVLAWQYAVWRLSVRTEGIVTIAVAFVTLTVLALFNPFDISAFDGELIIVYTVLFVYGLVRLADRKMTTRVWGTVLSLAGSIITGISFVGTSSVEGLLDPMRTALIGVVVTILGIMFVLRPDILKRVRRTE